MSQAGQAGSSGGGGGGGITGISGDAGGTATGPVVTLSGGTSGAVFTRSSNTITESFDYLSLPASGATNGRILIDGDPVLEKYDGSLGPNMFIGCATPTPGTLTGRRNISISNGEQGTLELLTAGDDNLGWGWRALGNLVDGVSNIAIGSQAGSSLFSNESSNILINNPGTTSESNAIHIGTFGTGAGQQNKCFIAGIGNVSLMSGQIVGIDSNGQLGTITQTGFQISQVGTATLSSGQVFVSASSIQFSSSVFISGAVLSGTPGFWYADSGEYSPGSGFVIRSSDSGDFSTVRWMIVN